MAVHEYVKVSIPDLGLMATGFRFNTPEEIAEHDGVRADPLPVIPPEQLTETPYHKTAPQVFSAENQNPYPECGGYATARCGETVFWKRHNVKVRFSPSAAYALAGGNGNNGTAITDLVKVAEAGFVLAADNQDHNYRLSAQARENRKKYRLKASRFLGSTGDLFGEVRSEIFRDKVILYGCFIGSSFRANAQGLVNERSGSGGGHAMMQDALKMQNGILLPDGWNSWGPQFGASGRMSLPRSYYEGRGAWMQAVSFELVEDNDPDGNDIPSV